MAVDPEHGSWINTMLGGLGLTSTALGGWVMKMSSRTARIEQKLDDIKDADVSCQEMTKERLDLLERNSGKRLDRIEDAIRAIRKHITGADL